MKKSLLKVITAICLFTAMGCQGSTSYGPCIGIGQQENPKFQYKVSVRNVILGVVFSEMIFPPAIWLLADYKCPVAVK